MSLTRAQAIAETFALFKAAWDTTSHADLVKYPNVSNDKVPPSAEVPWCRVNWNDNNKEQATLSGAVGSRRFTSYGILVVQVFVPDGKGLIGDIDYPKLISDAYEGKRTTSGIWFKNVTIKGIGSDGSFYQTNVIAEFEYDEIK
ncbi:MAG: hypothetical protein KAR40_06055 [Candidatus Sabulitectum sp.]|nr:hypothetical protein [Candidatus Sabulitectum sp.]